MIWMTVGGRSTAHLNSNGTAGRNTRTRSAWEMCQGVTVDLAVRQDAPCPRCGRDLRGPAHAPENLRLVVTPDGVTGYTCR